MVLGMEQVIDPTPITDEHRQALAKEGFIEFTEDVPDGVDIVDGKVRRICPSNFRAWLEAPYEFLIFKRGHGPYAEYKFLVGRKENRK